jgi:CheY-like chemotaxis protein
MTTIKRSSPKTGKGSASVLPRRATGRKRKLLVVDDIPSMREMLALVLEEKLSCEVVKAGSSEEALRIAKRRRFDLVTTDFVRPGMDGLSFLREFKARHPHVPVVMLTGHATTIRQRARRLGASGCISKPLKLGRLKYFEKFLG